MNLNSSKGLTWNLRLKRDDDTRKEVKIILERVPTPRTPKRKGGKHSNIGGRCYRRGVEVGEVVRTFKERTTSG